MKPFKPKMTYYNCCWIQNMQLILSIIMRLQHSIKPYKYYINNDLEFSAINAGIVTLFWGMIFSQSQASNDAFNTVALAFLILINSVFILQWVFFFLLSLNIKNEKFRVLLKIQYYQLSQVTMQAIIILNPA